MWLGSGPCGRLRWGADGSPREIWDLEGTFVSNSLDANLAVEEREEDVLSGSNCKTWILQSESAATI